MSSSSCIIPVLLYRNAPAAIEWLCNVFGFSKSMVIPGEGDTIAHSQLTLNGGMVMISSKKKVPTTEFGKLMAQPDEIGGRETQCSYIIVDDADAVYRRAVAAGARMVIEIRDEDYGGRGFGCYDIEGHLWSIGTYNPWQSQDA